ncbi:uncharacterized protein BDV17DRAFT_277689 [Aspergillus undulatus]|uniref:uncharacterized protein n=1 Tax=Aspergillus undulatus TaxID=1810928 RepID=UPI003CCE169B
MAELCWECGQWFNHRNDWHSHCQGHLDEPTQLLRCVETLFSKVLFDFRFKSASCFTSPVSLNALAACSNFGFYFTGIVPSFFFPCLSQTVRLPNLC